MLIPTNNQIDKDQDPPSSEMAGTRHIKTSSVSFLTSSISVSRKDLNKAIEGLGTIYISDYRSPGEKHILFVYEYSSDASVRTLQHPEVTKRAMQSVVCLCTPTLVYDLDL